VGWLGGKPNASKMRAKAKPKAKKRKIAGEKRNTLIKRLYFDL